MSRSDYDYQKSRRRGEQDHQFELFQIALSGDAMSYWLSQRQYNISRTREEEDFNLSRNRQQEDFSRQLGDSQTSFDIQRAQQLKMYEISREDAAVDFKIQRDRAKEQFDIQMGDMKYNFDEERRLRKIAFNDQLNDMITDAATYRQMLINQLYTPAGQDLNSFVTEAAGMFAQLNQRVAAATPGASHQFGGYANEGDRTHAGEFVLTSGTTAALERAAKSNKLSQANILQLIGGGGGAAVTYNDHRRIDTRISTADRAAMNQDTRELIEAILLGA
jgi:hypothetical protein